MTIFYFPNPSVAPNVRLPQYVAGPAPTSTGPIAGDYYVSQAGAVTHLEPGTGLNAGKNVWNKYTLASPVVPPTTPPIVVNTLVATTATTVGQSVNYRPITAYGGSGVATSYTTTGTVIGLNVSISPALPAGLSLTSTFTVSRVTGADSIVRLYNTVDVSVIGVPTVVSSTASYTVTVSDASGLSNSSSFNLGSNFGNTTLSTTLAAANVSLTQGSATGIPFTPVTATGGLGALTFTISPSLPAGLTLNSSTGQISGTPTATLPVTAFTISVTDTLNQVSSKSFNLSVTAVPVVTTLAIPSRTFTQGVAITAFTPVTATGGTGALTWSVSPALPAGLTLNTANGSITGTATSSAATANYVVTVTDSNTPAQISSKTFSLTVNALAPLTVTVPSATYNLTRNTAVTSFVPVAGAGGFGTLTYSISPALPAGLSFSATTGSVTGTPTTNTAAATYTVTVSDQASQTRTGSFSLDVTPAALATAYTSAQTSWTFIKNVTVAAFQPVRATGGDGTLAYSISPALPAGLTFNTTTGQISGTPTTDSTVATYTITVTDSVPQTSSKTISITVNNPAALTVSTVQAVTTVTQGAAIVPFQPVQGTGGHLSLSYSVSPVLPAGLSMAASSGQISGTPSAFTTSTLAFNVTVRDQAAQVGTSSFNLRVATLPIIATSRIPSQTLVKGVATSPFVPVTVTGGTTVYSYAISPSLPAGLSFNASTGAVSGTPTNTQGSASYAVTVTDTLGQTSSANFAIIVNNPPALVTSVTSATVQLVKGVTNANVNPIAASGGYGSITFAISPSLPSALSFSLSGKITGVAANLENKVYTVVATDSLGQTSTQTFTLDVINPPIVITTSSASLSLQRFKPASETPIGFTGGVTPVTFSISPSLPTGLSFNASTGAITGTPSNLSGAANYTVTVSDSADQTNSGVVSIEVIPPPAVSATTAVANVSTVITQAMTMIRPVVGAGGVGALTYDVSPSLPTGITLDSATGFLSGSPAVLSATATYSITVTDTVAQASTATFTLDAKPVPLTAAVQYGGSKALTKYSAVTPAPFVPVEPRGGFGTITWAITPSLPAGLNFNSSSGEIDGTPTAVAPAQTYAITVSDVAGQSATGTFVLSVTDIVYPALVAAVKVSNVVFEVNTIDTITPVEGNGGLAPYSYSLFPTTLPDGLSFDPATGSITGVASTTATTATYTITVTDSVPQTALANFTLRVKPQIITSPTILSNLTLTNGTESISTTTGALIVAGGIGVRRNVNVGGILHVRNTTQSTGTGTGALIVDGGAAVAGQLHAESVKIADTIFDSTEVLVNTTATVVVDQYPISQFRSAKYLVQIDEGTGPTADFQVIEILLLVDNAGTVYATEYGVVSSNGDMGEFAADVQPDDYLRLYFTAYYPTAKKIQVLRTGMST